MNTNRPIAATFSLNDYNFKNAILNFDIPKSKLELDLSFMPTAFFSSDKRACFVDLQFIASLGEKEHSDPEVVAQTIMSANFVFDRELTSKEDVPSYFYSNALAIMFPYVRAFISTLTLQANVKPLIIPTMNLAVLKEKLEQNTEF